MTEEQEKIYDEFAEAQNKTSKLSEILIALEKLGVDDEYIISVLKKEQEEQLQIRNGCHNKLWGKLEQ